MTTTIDQATSRLYIDWSSFNIGANDVVNFEQAASQWIAVNRVTGGLNTPTVIDGMLSAPGHIWIIDPAGILFSATASVDVGGLLATTANIDPSAFEAVTNLDDAGGFTFTSGGHDAAQIVNAGSLKSAGLLALVAPFVTNSGTLTSTYGDVLLGGANAFRLSFSQVARTTGGNQPSSFDELLVTDFIVEEPVAHVTQQGEVVPVTNTGHITGGNVIVSAASVGGGAFINMDGVVEATSIGTRSGDVVILGGGAFTGGAADAASGGTEDIRIANADITAPKNFVAQGSSVAIQTGTGPGTVAAGAIRLDASDGDVTSAAALKSNSGGIDIKAANTVSVKVLDATTSVDVTAKEIALDGKVSGGGAVTLTASDGDIAGTDIDIVGSSVELTGPVKATDSATIEATTTDVTLNDKLTSTGSVSVKAVNGTASVKGVEADTSVDIRAKEIALDGKVSGGGAVTLTASDGDIAGTDIDIVGSSVELAGLVKATDSATIEATTTDVTINDKLTSTGAASVKAANGTASVKGVEADSTLGITAKDIDLDGQVSGGGAVTLTASDGDIAGTDIDIVGSSVDLTGPVKATDSATIEATATDVTLNDKLTSTGSASVKAVNGTASVKGVEADTSVDIRAKEIALDGKVSGGGAVTLTASDGDIAGTDIDIVGSSVDLTGPVKATDSATIEATTTDVTLNDKLTSTGSASVKAVNGTASVKGVEADSTLGIAAKDIDLDGQVSGGGAVTLTASDGDITGTDIDIVGSSVELTGPVKATDSATIEATTTDVTLNDKLTSTGSALLKATNGTVSLAEVEAGTTLDVRGADIEVLGDAIATGDATFKASTGDARLSGMTKSITGNVIVEAKLGLARVNDVTSALATTLIGGSIEVLGDIVSAGQATLQALTGNVDVQGSVTANGGVLLLDAAHGDAVINRIAALTNVNIVALDLDLSGSISAGDQVYLTSLDSGTTVVLGGNGGTGSVALRKPAGLTIDADELGRISAGSLRIDAAGNDALLLGVNFNGATLGDFSIGASAGSQIITAGTVLGLNSLTLGYVDGLEDRRPGLILVTGQLGVDSVEGTSRLGSVVLNSSQDIIIGSQMFQTYYEMMNPTLAQLGKPSLPAMRVKAGHVFIASNALQLYAPGDIVQLNTGNGVDGKGLIFQVATVGTGVLYPVETGPEKVVLFGVVIRDDGTRVNSFSAGLEPRLLYPGITDEDGNVIEEPLEQSDDYHFNLCIIGDPVSCSDALLRQAEATGAAANSDPNPALSPTGLTFETGDDDDDDDDSDSSGVAATGNESLWGQECDDHGAHFRRIVADGIDRLHLSAGREISNGP